LALMSLSRSKSEVLNWLFHQLAGKMLGYRNALDFTPPAKRPKERVARMFIQGLLARVAVERGKIPYHSLERAAGWVASQIPKHARARLTDRPDDLQAEILAWRVSCYKPGIRRDAFKSLDDGESRLLCARGELGLNVIIKMALGYPAL
jgi:hypothetical protein